MGIDDLHKNSRTFCCSICAFFNNNSYLSSILYSIFIQFVGELTKNLSSVPTFAALGDGIFQGWRLISQAVLAPEGRA